MDHDVKRQVLKYARDLNARFAIMTNGRELCAYQIVRGKPERLTAMPSYAGMVGNRVPRAAAPEPWIRPSTSKLAQMSRKEINLDERLGGCLGRSTRGETANLVLELASLLLDEGQGPGVWSAGGLKMSPEGLKHVTPRNPSGGNWSGLYRQWLVRTRCGGHRLVSVAVMAAWNDKSMLLIGTDQKGRTANALQLALDEFMVLGQNEARMTHNGRMRGGVKCATKAAMLDWLEDEAPHLLDADGVVDLGVLPVGRRLRWSHLRCLVVRCTEYALAREEFMRRLTDHPSDAI